MTDRTPHYRHVLESVERLVARESESDEILRQTVGLLHDRFDDYSWVGIYLVEGNDLMLGPWKGPEAYRARANPDRAGHLRRRGRDRANRDRGRRGGG